MKKLGVLRMVMAATVGTWLGAGLAQAAVVASTPASTYTLEIQSDAGVSLQESQFPDPGQILKLVLKDSGVTRSITSLSLQNTTAYPGMCTNYPSPPAVPDTGPDFVVVSGYLDRIQSTDCGGSTQVIVNGSIVFDLIKDSDADGIPDWYEQQHCGSIATCLNRDEDIDLLGTQAYRGDGFSNIDEYRGFIVSSVNNVLSHVRPSPLQKDVFVHLENPDTPSCNRLYSTAPSLPGPDYSLLGLKAGEPPRSLPAVVYPTDNTTLFAHLNLGGASTPVAFRFLDYQSGKENIGTDKWIERFDYFNPNTADQTKRIVYKDGTYTSSDDRQVNFNAISNPGGVRHKGIRLIECLQDVINSPVGDALFPPNIQVGTPGLETNSVIYTQRIFNDFARLLQTTSTGSVSAYQACALAATPTSSGTAMCVLHQTYPYGVTPATTPTNRYPKPGTPATQSCVKATSPDANCATIDRNYITSKYIQYILAMELGHTVALIPAIQITQYGSHYAPGTGDNLDQRVVAKDSKQQKGIIFSIPSSFGPKSDKCFQLVGQGTGQATNDECQ